MIPFYTYIRFECEMSTVQALHRRNLSRRRSCSFKEKEERDFLCIDFQESATINYLDELAISLFASVSRLPFCPGFIVSFVYVNR